MSNPATVQSRSSDVGERAIYHETPGDLETAIDYILDECFFAVGQVVGTRKSVDYEAVMWWRNHYRAVFLASMNRFGDRWQVDRHIVTAVGMLMGERAVKYCGGKPSIDVDAARRAAADASRYCELHAQRSSRRRSGDDALPMLAGYWCVPPDDGGSEKDPENP